MKTMMKVMIGIVALVSFSFAAPAGAVERPWISDVFFYWYTWDYDRELGSWVGGIHNTPLDGYYDSRSFRDNRRSLWQASEWGLTHHFMDYWSPDWKGEDGQMREAVVMKAAESLRKDGYNIWMSYYQDGENFEMREFSRNVSERRDVHQWLRDFAGSEVWPKLDGKPLQLVYARNGRPKTTIDQEGFRQFLRERYKDIDALNVQWQTEYAGFDDVTMDLSATGHQRAASIEFQYALWQQEWQKLDQLVQKEFGFPGMLASFDVGYEPFDGFGFANFARTFGGPHSYAGIFGQPHDQDAQRFIQAAVAKKYNTVFLDHFKNYYFDWDIRVPGTAYPPDPFHFDRFWVGALARHSEALLHLSWNEWWEGSNLEPCHEFGKTYCEKNLFYSTLMQLAFESIQTAGRGAPVALLLNDWRFASGAGHDEELYGIVQILRRLNVPFDLLPDEMVTAEQLEQFQLVIAPAFGCGLGYNQQREPMMEVVADWLRGGDRRLIVSGHRSVADKFGLREQAAPAAAPAAAGPDLNVYVDVGTEADEQFLRTGYSMRETGMGTAADNTFRWTPGVGKVTSWVLPASPHRDHILRLHGTTIWPNTVSVVLNGREVGELAIAAGPFVGEFAVPAAAVAAAPMVSLEMRFAQAHVPGQKAPEQYRSENRVCNLSLNALQWSTANVAAGVKQPEYQLVDDSVQLTDPLFGAAPAAGVAVPYEPRPVLTAPGAKILSRLGIGQTPRDILVPFAASQVLYVNGSLAEVEEGTYWLPLLRDWGRVDFERFAVGEHCMTSRLQAGDTHFVVAFNESITEPRDIELSCPGGDVPLSEARVLHRDGSGAQPLDVASDPAGHRTRDRLNYYGVYQFAYSPVRIQTPELVLQPGESRTFSCDITNLTDAPVRGSVQAASVIPTISGSATEVELNPRETRQIPVDLRVAPTADWGTKTIYVELKFEQRRAVVLRELVVQKPTEVELGNTIVDAGNPRVVLRVPENAYGQTAPLSGARLTIGGQSVDLPEIQEGGSANVSLPPLESTTPDKPSLAMDTLQIELGLPDARRSLTREVFVRNAPRAYPRQPDAQAVLVVSNARATAFEHEPLAIELPESLRQCGVMAQDGKAVASQVDPSGHLRFAANVPAHSVETYYLCPVEGDVATDLQYKATDLGTGLGTLEVTNAHLAVVLSERVGGTVAGLRSAKTDRDYGRNSFGINYGAFSQYDPLKLPTDTVRYIHEQKVRQEDTPGRIELLSAGPAVVMARVAWADERVAVEQTYAFPAHQPYFLIRARVVPRDLAGQQELVALDAQFRPHQLTKSYPTFVGAVSGGQQPHFGWRTGTWVPDYVTLMTPGEFEESISLITTRSRGLQGIRQGFWPAERPQPGKCEIARVELLGDPTAGCDYETYVLLHAGHQVVAKQFLAEIQTSASVELVTDPRWTR